MVCFRLAKVPAAAAMEPPSTHGRHEDTRSGIAQGALWTKRPATVHSCGGDLTRATQCHKQPRWSDTVPGERRRPTGGLWLSQRILHQKDVPEQRQSGGNDASHLLFAA